MVLNSLINTLEDSGVLGAAITTPNAPVTGGAIETAATGDISHLRVRTDDAIDDAVAFGQGALNLATGIVPAPSTLTPSVDNTGDRTKPPEEQGISGTVILGIGAVVSAIALSVVLE